MKWMLNKTFGGAYLSFVKTVVKFSD